MNIKYPERMRLRVESVLHQIYLEIRLHQEIQVLKGFPWEEGFHVVVRLAAGVLLRITGRGINEKGKLKEKDKGKRASLMG